MTTDPQKPFRELIESAKRLIQHNGGPISSEEAKAAGGPDDYVMVRNKDFDALVAKLAAAEASLPALAGGDNNELSETRYPAQADPECTECDWTFDCSNGVSSVCRKRINSIP